MAGKRVFITTGVQIRAKNAHARTIAVHTPAFQLLEEGSSEGGSEASPAKLDSVVPAKRMEIVASCHSMQIDVG